MSIFQQQTDAPRDHIFSPGDGYLAVAPYGTPGPTSGTAALQQPWQDLGLIQSDAGASESRTADFSEIRSWPSNHIVRRTITDSALTIGATLLETNAASVELFYGASPDASGRVVIVPGETGGRFAVVKDLWDGGQIVRTHYPNCEVTEVGEQSFTAGEHLGWPITITAYPDPSLTGRNGRQGVAEVWIIPLAQAQTPPPAPPNILSPVAADYADSAASYNDAVSGYDDGAGAAPVTEPVEVIEVVEELPSDFVRAFPVPEHIHTTR